MENEVMVLSVRTDVIQKKNVFFLPNKFTGKYIAYYAQLSLLKATK